jgi:hypothetical protein
MVDPLATPRSAAGKTIHLVFKTHLDIGFTDLAARVRRQYHERFIPQAIDTGEHFFRERPEQPRFIWTTGAWLIWDHLNSQPPARVRRLEQAIARGLIRWHAIPFTTHSELMSPALFRAGLSYAAELDRRFGVTTIAAKMTDVPGHTRGIVPLLAEAGVKFLHLGVNAASPIPDVPEVFRWRAPAGEEILVMYQKSYGATHFPHGFDDGLSFAHTNDNVGPQNVGQTADAYRSLEHAYPGATIRASTLDDYAALLWARRDEFPIIDLELGDNWIHGAASDPVKLQRFLALQRLYDGFARDGLTPRRLAFGRGLAMVAEHTWGVDIKSFLRDETAWDRPRFEAMRQADFRFAFAEASWAEQRAYLDAAVSELDPADRRLARTALAALRPPAARRPSRPSGGPLQLGGWTIDIDPASGDLTSITSPAGRQLAGRDGSLVGFRYESYDADDMARHLDSHLTQRLEWALLDHGKPGLEHARTAQSRTWTPALTGVSQRAGEATLALTLPAPAHDALGGPEAIEVRLRPASDEILQIDLVLRQKPANRMPEAMFLTLTPAADGPWHYQKMGLWQPGERVAASGGGQLQAVSAARCRIGPALDLTVTPLDTPLVGPAGADFMTYMKTPPDLSAGLRFNLCNNKWGTNFPMWWDGDLLARFELRFDAFGSAPA